MTGRPTKLTPETQTRICDALRAGSTRKASAEYGGVEYVTLCEWIQRGEGTHERRTTAAFAEFADAVMRAESDCEVGLVAVIKKAAMGYDTGGEVTKTVKVTNIVNGKPVTTERTETTRTIGREFDWRAAESWLKRRRRDEWGDNASVELDQRFTTALAAFNDSAKKEVSSSD